MSRSGGMSNELNNIISRTTNGVYEGVAIGGDRYAALYYDRNTKIYNKINTFKEILYNLTSHVWRNKDVIWGSLIPRFSLSVWRAWEWG